MINYRILSDSIDYYTINGFSRIESPWTVTPNISNITKSETDKTDFEIKYNGKVLVASGEQSFLYLYLKGFLPKGRFQTTTPCFRYESFDFLHTKYFIKNELIDTINVNKSNLEDIVDISLNFFKKYLPNSSVEKIGDTYDITYLGYELGSYGIRQCEYLEWIYATGCAEPRLSNIINLNNLG